jgi:hypothetical protein
LGLLERRRKSREYEYAITLRGEDRLIHLWEVNGYVDTQKQLSKEERGTMESRCAVILALLEQRLETIRSIRE